MSESIPELKYQNAEAFLNRLEEFSRGIVVQMTIRKKSNGKFESQMVVVKDDTDPMKLVLGEFDPDEILILLEKSVSELKSRLS